MKLWKKNLILILLAVLIAVVPLIFLKDAAFEGADGQAEEAIGEIAPDYEPWFDSIIELPSGEVESLLFCVQAALGAGIMGFILGRMTKKPKQEGSEVENR